MPQLSTYQENSNGLSPLLSIYQNYHKTSIKHRVPNKCWVSNKFWPLETTQELSDYLPAIH